MRKKYLSALLFGAFLFASTGTFTSCKDYDDDITNLQTQVDGIKADLEDLQGIVNAGAVITSVETITDGNGGIKITLSDGKVYEVLNGANGTNGADAVVWTIGEDGYWYKDGTKTEYQAIGSSTEAEPVEVYVPNKETGYFDIYKDGEFVEQTDLKWAASGVTAVKNGNTLVFSNVDGSETSVELTLGEALGSVAFLPEKVSATLPYPTTTEEFFYVAEYFDESKYETTTKDFIAQDLDKSNVVDMLYRLNPTGAYVGEDTSLKFVNRAVSTRATGDKNGLLTIHESEIVDGEVTAKTLFNATKLEENSLAALQVFSGQETVTSDFVHITSTAIDAVIADSAKTVVGSDAEVFYPRTKAIVGANGETSDFIQQFVALNDETNCELLYTGSLDLTKVVGLYSNNRDEYLSDLGFYGMEYDFDLPKEYLANDEQKTNQQWFVTLDKAAGKLSVNTANLGEGTLTPAIGRTPVVRVDAFLVDNHGDRRMVGSSYIKVKITDTPSTPAEDIKPINANIDVTAEKDYYTLSNTYTEVGAMSWEEINTQIYGQTHLTAESFWNHYGGDDNTYNIKIEAEGVAGTVTVMPETTVNNGINIENNGIQCIVNLNNENQKTSNVEVAINNKVLTQNTYKDVDGKGAKYTVTITLKSDDATVHPDVILTQVFYVKEECQQYTYNPLYHVTNYDGHTGDLIVVKGQLNASNAWEMSTALEEHFTRKSGDGIFDAGYLPANVNSIDFAWAIDETGVTMNTTNHTVALSNELTEPYAIKTMTYTTTLANGEECDYSYDIVFENPFVAGNAGGVELVDGVGVNTVDTKHKVLVKDTEGDDIYSWKGTLDSGSLELSEKATNTYKLTNSVVSVAYKFVQNEAYTTIDNDKSEGSILAVDETTGVVTWKNQGSLLQSDYALQVKATVTFTDLSKVEVIIPVTLKKR